MNLHLSFFVVSLLGFVENPEYVFATPKVPNFPKQHPMMSINNEPPKYLLPGGGSTAVSILLSIILIVAQATVPRSSIKVVSECKESLSETGDIESECGGTNIERLYRDVTMLSSWGGPTDTITAELVKALLVRQDAASGVRGFNVVGEWVEANLGTDYTLPVGENRDMLEQCKVRAWRYWLYIERHIGSRSREELAANGQELANCLGYVVSAVLLIMDARRDGDTLAVETCRRWIFELQETRGRCRVKEATGHDPTENRQMEEQWSEVAEIDYHITFGTGIDRRSGLPKL